LHIVRAELFVSAENLVLPKLYLSSQSPRRKQILESLGLSFEVLLPDAEEAMPEAHEVESVTKENAKLKALSILPKLSRDNDIAIGADTLVILENQVMGKPRDTNDVVTMLGKLSGKTHLVVTGLSLATKRTNAQSLAKSWITFKKLSPALIQEYASTKEPYDKAGSYAVQGMGGLFIEKIDGSYTNVMGFPMELFLEELARFTGIPVHRWFQ
jgi:septum formation protein